MLDEKRVKEMFALFASVLPKTATSKQNKIIEKRLGITLDEFIGTGLMSLAEDCMQSEKHAETAEWYFDFICEAIMYMKGETDEYPTVEFED